MFIDLKTYKFWKPDFLNRIKLDPEQGPRRRLCDKGSAVLFCSFSHLENEEQPAGGEGEGKQREGNCRQYPKIGETKNGNSVFFHQRHALSTSFNIFVLTHSVTNFLPKLVDILLFSTEKLNFLFFHFPIFWFYRGRKRKARHLTDLAPGAVWWLQRSRSLSRRGYRGADQRWWSEDKYDLEQNRTQEYPSTENSQLQIG